MNYLQLCQALRQECGIQGTGPTAVTSQTGILKRIVDYIASADESIQLLHADWEFLVSTWSDDTVVGTESYTAPTDLGAWNRESFAVDRGTSTARTLRVVPYQRRVYERSNEEPSYVMVHPSSGNIVLQAPADAVYELSADYWAAPTKMTANTDTSDIPAQFHRVIIARGKMWFAEDEELPNLFQTAAQEYATLLSALEAHSLPGQNFRAQAQAIPMAVRTV